MFTNRVGGLGRGSCNCWPPRSLTMQLHQITLEHVRLHRQLNLPLASGITVLEGANESGKSTLAEAIHRPFLPARSAGAGLNQLRSPL